MLYLYFLLFFNFTFLLGFGRKLSKVVLLIQMAKNSSALLILPDVERVI